MSHKTTAVIGVMGITATLWFAVQAWHNAVECCWRHGTPHMQAIAAPLLTGRIEPGTTYDEVLALIGPGCDDLQKLKAHKPGHGEIVSFNVRADYQTGIDVMFFNGRAVRVTQSPTAAGPLTFKNLDPGHLWIYTDRFKYISPHHHASEGWMIQLDGIRNPYKHLDNADNDSRRSLQKEINDAIYRRLETQLLGKKNMWLLVTNDPYAPSGEVGGILFTGNDRQHSIQEQLIAEGLVQVDRDEDQRRIPAKYKELWIKLEEDAKKNSRGFWKTHPELF